MSYDLSWLEEENAQNNDKKKTTKIKILDSNNRDIQSSHADNKILSELEFKMFNNAIELIYKSNYRRYKTSRSKGMLNALNILKEIKEIIRERLK